MSSPLFCLQPRHKNIHHPPFTRTGKQIRFPSWKDHSTNPISHHFLCMLHFHPACGSAPRRCSECLITAVKRIQGRGGECSHQMNAVSIFHFPRQREGRCWWSMERWQRNRVWVHFNSLKSIHISSLATLPCLFEERWKEKVQGESKWEHVFERKETSVSWVMWGNVCFWWWRLSWIYCHLALLCPLTVNICTFIKICILYLHCAQISQTNV